ncbi:Protein prenyltransferase, alpha subunit [Phytophthora cactorum]|nr:Protein prenyltransferase, alpha subunit [Phytophthora cactorum]
MDTVTDRVNFRELLSLLHEEGQPNAPKLERTLFTRPQAEIRHLKKHLAALLKLDNELQPSGLSESAKARKSTGVAIRQDLQCDQELEGFYDSRYRCLDFLPSVARPQARVAFAAGIPLFQAARMQFHPLNALLQQEAAEITQSKDNQRRSQLLHCMRAILLISADFYTAWNTRRWLAIRLCESLSGEELRVFYEQQIEVCSRLAEQKPRNYHAWSFRHWIVSCSSDGSGA